jgi:HPt (histidine-containing phosphotransfer) domain-containing protein
MELVENPYVSDFTKKTLEQFGWKNGDPIPADLGEVMVNIKNTLPPSDRVDVLIAKEDMSEADVDRVKKLLRTAKDVSRKQTEAEKYEEETAGMSDSVRKALDRLKTSMPEIVDDREEAAAAEPTAAAEAPAPAEAPVTAPESETAPELPLGTTGVNAPMLVLPFCPRCGWDMQQKFDVEVTDTDKEDFLATLLGGERFRRDYELAGGKMRVRFRSMLADENFLVQRQLLLDQANKEIFSEAEWFLRMAEYRMACSLEGVYNGEGKPIMLNSELHDVQFTPPEHQPTQTALPTARQNINTKVLAHEVTRRLVANQLRKFQRLIEALEAMALEPSFWNGIE